MKLALCRRCKSYPMPVYNEVTKDNFVIGVKCSNCKNRATDDFVCVAKDKKAIIDKIMDKIIIFWNKENEVHSENRRRY